MCYQIMNIMNVLAILIQNTEVIAFREERQLKAKRKKRKKAAVYFYNSTKSWEQRQWQR